MNIFVELGMNPTKEDIEKMIEEVDDDGSGEIGFTEVRHDTPLVPMADVLTRRIARSF